jgi:hypothetical protein
MIALVAATFVGAMVSATTAEAQKGGPGFARGGGAPAFRGGMGGGFRAMGAPRVYRGGFRTMRPVGMRAVNVGRFHGGFVRPRVHAGLPLMRGGVPRIHRFAHRPHFVPGFRHRLHRRVFVGAPLLGAAYLVYNPYAYGYYDGCLVQQLVRTPWGLQWAWVDVCNDYY